MEVTWSEFKKAVDDRLLSIQYVELESNYYLKIIDGFFELSCVIPTDPSHVDTADFVANYKPQGNVSPKTEVVTQFERDDKTLKLASAAISVAMDGKAILLIKIPGTPNPYGDKTLDGRWLSEGIGWFEPLHPDDRVISVKFKDMDGISGAPAGTVIGSYTDDDLNADLQGWRIPYKLGHVIVETIGDYGFAPSGYWLEIVGQSGNGYQIGKKMYINLNWGKKE